RIRGRAPRSDVRSRPRRPTAAACVAGRSAWTTRGVSWWTPRRDRNSSRPARGPTCAERVASAQGARYRPPMSFTKRLLVPGEELVLDLRPHWIALLLPTLATLGVVVVGFWLISKFDGS